MFYVYKSLVPVVFGVRFLPLIVHLVILILLVLDPAPNVKTNLEISGDLTRKSSVENSNFVWLYLSIGFLSLEMISYLAGYTSIYAFQSFISILAHSTAVIYLFPYYLDTYSSDEIRWVFGFATALPLITEALSYSRLKSSL